MIRTVRLNTPIGEMIAGATEDGVCLLEFTDTRKLSPELRDLERLLGTTIEEGDNSYLKMLKTQLSGYFEGKIQEFTVPVVIPGSEFQKIVWQELMNIPFGSTRSYHRQAEILEIPGSARAVANANARNRISIVIPCHRVIGSDGRLTGYAGGLKRKKWLLDHEKRYSGKPADPELF